MEYRPDPDLEFLGACDSDDLDPLVRYLTRDGDGDRRLTEELTRSEEYRRHAPDHARYWRLVAAELQAFGGNSIATLLRGGKGVLYREILDDVCDHLDVDHDGARTTEAIEASLLAKVVTDSLEKMDEEQRRELAESLELGTTSFTPQAVTAALQAAIAAGGFISYKLAVIVANAFARMLLGRGLSFAANATLTRAIGIAAGPIGWAVTGAWTLVTVAGPAYRVTVPAVIQIAFLRRKVADRAPARTLGAGSPVEADEADEAGALAAGGTLALAAGAAADVPLGAQPLEDARKALARLRLAGWCEGGSFLLLLLVAMPLKYLAGYPLAVRIVGMAHGVFFLAYLVAVVQAATELRWTWRRIALAVGCALVPFAVFPFDAHLRRELAGLPHPGAGAARG